MLTDVGLIHVVMQETVLMDTPLDSEEHIKFRRSDVAVP
jgi:hypothetical protein